MTLDEKNLNQNQEKAFDIIMKEKFDRELKRKLVQLINTESDGEPNADQKLEN